MVIDVQIVEVVVKGRVSVLNNQTSLPMEAICGYWLLRHLCSGTC